MSPYRFSDLCVLIRECEVRVEWEREKRNGGVGGGGETDLITGQTANLDRIHSVSSPPPPSIESLGL